MDNSSLTMAARSVRQLRLQLHAEDSIMAAASLPQRPLGATGVTVPLIGYGTAPLGKETITREHATRCLNHAIDAGITYLDTSPDYGSEPHVGAVMQTRREAVFLATK